MLFNWTINFGHIITVTTVLLAGMGFIYSLRGRMDNLADRLSVLENDIKQLIGVLVQQGKQEERTISLDTRLANQSARLDDLTRRFNSKTDVL